ncbi:tRNA and rRNA cytosine-C5-methylase [Corynebacterium suranareeae]|uniref:tRNA and rRNA cytosine-C5-methylase n=1 Tax=Corynebacterium suranareeae TaxID=2506452 RepID=A0A160PS25_9CORY|nr:transcription antitermination factor NusB [Corynebacterium suranareeae]BAU95943.1 tRNA and rRNA cytosine-C5-methylase [Corynebacterium suranareeae]
MSLEKSGGFRSRTPKAKQAPKKQAPKKQAPAKGRAGGNRKPPAQARELRALGVDKPREIAFEVLDRVRTDKAYANLILPRLLSKHHLSGRDAAFATEITYGTLRNVGLIDEVIKAASGRELGDIDPEILDVLRLGAYQVLFTRVEDHAAVDTSVKMVGGLKKFQATGFANAILRNITRKTPEQWLKELEPTEEIARVAFRTAHPRWIAKSFSQVLPKDELEQALRADSERPVVHLVARPGEISAEELALITGGEEGKYSPYAVYLDGGDPADIEPVKEGLAAVQDEGSQLIARALVEVPVEGTDGGRWLDMCAGPGGKAALIGALARMDRATVDAVEVSEHRARLIEKSVRGLPVKVQVGDGRNINLKDGYDRALVDAPCSGLGALRRRPEARWRKQESDIAELNTLQFELLESAVNKVRSGGVIVYSTCSPDLRETRNIVDKALSSLNVEELNAGEFMPGMTDTGEEKSVQMWPHRHGTDAMFVAVLRKK